MNHKVIFSITTSSAHNHRIQKQGKKGVMFLRFSGEYLLNLYNIESFSPTMPTNVKASYTA